MTDRELLELAAKAAGIEVIRSRLDDPMNADFLVRGGSRNPYHEFGAWNPLSDDGDALRLAAKLYLWDAVRLAHREVSDAVDIYAATRRAIVRAAAALAPPQEQQ